MSNHECACPLSTLSSVLALGSLQFLLPRSSASRMPLCSVATASRLKYLAVVATTVIATARPSTAFVGSSFSSTSTSAASSRRGGRRQQCQPSLTMGSPPLAAEERVVIVGGGIGDEGLRVGALGLNLNVAKRVGG